MLLVAMPSMKVGRDEAGKPAPRAALAMYAGSAAAIFALKTALATDRVEMRQSCNETALILLSTHWQFRKRLRWIGT